MSLSHQRRCWLDCISLLGGYNCIGWIVSYRLDPIRKHWILCADWLLAGLYRWYICTGWDVSGTGVGWIDVRRRQNESTTIDAGTGAPQLALEGRQAVGSGGWHQLRWCCKDAIYLCQSRKITKIDCTKIRNNT